MKKNSPMSIALVVAAFAVAIYFLVPSITYYSKSPEQRESYIRDNPNALKKILNLGLDLQGGMRLVLEIDKSKLSEAEGKDVLDRAYTIIENRINALGVSEPTIQKQGDDRIIVELPGLKDETAAKNVIGKTAQLEFNLLREAALITQALTIIDNVVTGKQAKDTGSTADAEQQKQQELGESLFKGSDSKDSVKTDTSKSTAEKVVPFSEMLA
jgi:preprotein translocase subunit SecD